jgi:tetratricopeptide (TPR) repeat protein
LGKSSLAARLCDRLTDFERIVWVGEIDEPSLVHRLANKLDDKFLRETLQSNDEELRFKVRRVFVQLEEKSAKPLLLVLDDFEANLEPRGDTFVLNPEAASVLSALVIAIQESNTQHRLILTCRYDFDFTLLQHFYKQSLDALQGADLEKKCSSLNSFKFNSGVDNELQVKALHLADGNPRLLEWLDKVLQSPENTTIDADAILQRLEDSKVELREKVLAKTLLGMINQQMREVLQLGLVFDLPVPREAMIEIASHIPESVNYIDRAIALGLLESSFDHCLRVPRILFIDSEENLSFSLPVLKQAAQILHRLWYVNAETSTEEQHLEIHRLALAAQETDIAVEMAKTLTNRWIAQSRFRETLQICKSTLEITRDYRVLHNLARSEAELGEVEQAKQHYQEVLNNCSPDDEQFKATTIHNLAIIYANQGNVTEAIALYQQSLDLEERIGNVQGKAASLHCLAIIYADQGNVTEAIALYQQSLELKERIGDVQGKAASLHQLAGIYANQGNVTEAIALYQQSLELKERIGNVQGKAASLAMLGQLLADASGDFSTALSYLEQSLEILQHLQSPDAQVVRGIIARIQQSAKEEQSKSGENTPAPHRRVHVSQILILGAVVLLSIGGFFVFKLQQGGFIPKKPNPTLSPR